MSNLSPAEYRREVNNAMSEATLQKKCEKALGELGCEVFHAYDMRRSQPGYPDITCVTPDGRMGLFELKVESKSKGRLTDHQKRWLTALGNVAVHEPRSIKVAVIRPSDYDYLICWALGEVE